MNSESIPWYSVHTPRSHADETLLELAVSRMQELLIVSELQQPH